MHKNNKELSTIKTLVGGYVAISVGAVIALIALHNHHNLATKEAWVHGIIVATTALLMALFTRGMIHGSAKARLRLRITTAIMLVAIAVTSAIPGDFPLWMKVEQGVCGVLLLGVVILINRRRASITQ